MWLKKIKKRKLQFILIATILMVASFIFALCTNMANEVSSYVGKYYDNKEIMDFTIHTPYDDEAEKIIEYAKCKYPSNNNLVEGKALVPDRNIYLRERNLNSKDGVYLNVMEAGKSPFKVDITNGEKKSKPSEGEIWVTNLQADIEGIKIGDIITIKNNNENIELKVAALINDSKTPNSATTQPSLYISNEDYNKIENLVKLRVIGFNTGEETKVGLPKLLEYMGGSVRGVIQEKDTLIMGANAGSSITSSIGISVSIMIFIVAIVIVRFILWNNILKEYKSIGIYKSMGLGSKQIRNIYIKAFGLVGVIAIIVGSFLSLLSVASFSRPSLQYIGVYSVKNVNIMFPLITIVLMSIILIGNLYVLLRKINKINPVEALRVGNTSSKKKMKKSLIKDASTPITMVINDIWRYKKQNMIITVVLTMVIFLGILFVNIDNSMANISSNVGNWFGIYQSDLTANINAEDFDEIIDIVKQDSNVKGYKYGEFFGVDNFYIDVNKYNIETSSVPLYVYDNYREEAGFKVPVKEGRHPEREYEIALSERVLSDSGLKIGDYIEVEIDDELKDFLITGSYVGMINGGYNGKIIIDSIPINDKNRFKQKIYLNFTDQSKIGSFESKLKSKFPDITFEIIPQVVINSTAQMSEMTRPITRMLVVAITFFSLINIVNLIVINNKDNRKNYGIMKSLGFTSGYIVKRIVYRISILTLISVIIGTVSSLALGRSIFKAMIMGADGMLTNLQLSTITVIGICIVIIMGTILSMLSIKKISTVELMEE